MRPYRLHRMATIASLLAATGVRCSPLQSAALLHRSAAVMTLTRTIHTSATEGRGSAVTLSSSASLSRQLEQRGSGAVSPALFRPTRLARIPPQLMRLLVAGGAALLQVFVIAFQRESHRLKSEAAANNTTAEGSASMRRMSGAEAMQVLGLDRSHPSLFSDVQGEGSTGNAAGTTPSLLLPLKEGKAREEGRQNFDRMFALAIRDENLFLAGKLSAAYRVCVDPAWDQMEEVDGGEETRAAFSHTGTKEDGQAKQE